jgi:hypothetical protein
MENQGYRKESERENDKHRKTNLKISFSSTSVRSGVLSFCFVFVSFSTIVILCLLSETPFFCLYSFHGYLHTACIWTLTRHLKGGALFYKKYSLTADLTGVPGRHTSFMEWKGLKRKTLVNTILIPVDQNLRQTMNQNLTCSHLWSGLFISKHHFPFQLLTRSIQIVCFSPIHHSEETLGIGTACQPAPLTVLTCLEPGITRCS